MKKYVFAFLFLSFNFLAQAQDFITRWDLSLPGSGATQLSFGVGTVGTCSYTWETVPAGATGSGTFNGNTISITGLPAGATILLKIDTTNYRRIIIDSGIDRSRLLNVQQWGGVHWSSMESAFHDCGSLNAFSVDLPDLTNVTSLKSMFQDCRALIGPLNIGNWNTSTITDMSRMFEGAVLFNMPIGNWNTSNVTNMAGMFNFAFSFNQAIGSWNTSNVLNMSHIFSFDTSFNQPIGNWDVSNVEDMSFMFYHSWNNTSMKFNQPLNSWNTSNVVSMESMFHGLRFNQLLDNWDVSNLVNMRNMFYNNPIFNQPLNIWNTGSVNNMSGVFAYATVFNQPLDNWNIGNVTDLSYMFYNANTFNQAIGNWNTSSVTNMSNMFSYASVFNQPLDTWDVSNVTDMSGMFSLAYDFNQPLANWNVSNVINMFALFCNCPFNQPLSSWDVSNVKKMDWMFRGCSFNQPIGNWNTSNVTDMNNMFTYNYNFGQAIENWDVSNVISFSRMFAFSNFNHPLNNWNVSNAKIMDEMFSNNVAFNKPLNNWNMTGVKSTGAMFAGATNFNQPLNNWNMTGVKNTEAMFAGATNFNQPLNNWNLDSLVSMAGMFAGASNFNQPLNNWTVDSVTNMSYLFKNATAFNQNIGSWNFNPNVSLYDIFTNSGINCGNYTFILQGWAANPNIPSNLYLGYVNLAYLFNAIPSRNFLINNKGWAISGDILSNGNCCIISNTNYSATACNSYFFDGQTLTNSGQYYDTLINAIGCDSFIILNLIINQINTTVTQSGASLTANATGATYQWLTCNPFQEIIGETNQNYIASTNGDYAVIVTQNGCTDTSSCYSVIGIGFDHYDLSNSIKIFPNPVHHLLQIESSSSLQNAEICVLNLMGQNIATYKNISNNTFAIDMSALTPGNYFIQIKDANNSFVKKVRKD